MTSRYKMKSNVLECSEETVLEIPKIAHELQEKIKSRKAKVGIVGLG